MKPIILNDQSIILWLNDDDTGRSVQLTAEKEGFRRQDKRHITILSGTTKDTLKVILSKFSDKRKEIILQEIKDIAKNLKWKYKPKPEEIYKIQRTGHFDDPNVIERRESYVCMVSMPDMEVFYRKLNYLLKSNLPVQVPHITLFTKGERQNPKYYGIGICSEENFKSYNPKKAIC